VSHVRVYAYARILQAIAARAAKIADAFERRAERFFIAYGLRGRE
jgi:hypothetical protein